MSKEVRNKMTKRNFTVDVSEQICPDRWSYSFDGKQLIAREEFDDIADAELKELAERWMRVQTPPRTVRVEGKTFIVTRESTQAEALMTLAIEGTRQASVLGLVELDTVLAVIEETMNAIEGVNQEGKEGK